MAKGKSTAIVKRSQESGGLVVADWMRELAGNAKKVAAIFRVGIPRIQHRQGMLMIDGQPVKDNKLQVCIVPAAAFEKKFYKGAYDPDTKEAPDCYSFHDADRPMAEAHIEMVPNPACKDKQNDRCAGCRWNAFGTARPRSDGKPSKGKRCADAIRVLCFMADGKKDSILNAQVRLLSIPPSTFNNWSAYTTSLADMDVDVGLVVTEIGIQPTPTAYALTFTAVQTVNEGIGKAVRAKASEALQTLTMPYPTLGTAEAEKPENLTKRVERKKKVQ